MSALRTSIVCLCVIGAAAGDWPGFLSGLKGKTNVDWKKACGVLGQTAQGYGMSSGGGVSSYHLTCSGHKITISCHGNPFTSCTSAYKPPVTAGDTPPTGKYNVKAGSIGSTKFSPADVQKFLNIMNKMRCAVGVPPLHWDAALASQAQKSQNEIGGFVHSKSYDLPIPAGENLASGTKVATAAWMWFTEYTQTTDYENNLHLSGHYSAMTWKGVTKVGCALQKSGKGVVRCQFVGSPLPNMGGSYDKNVVKFMGAAADFKKCGLTIGEVSDQVKVFKGWGILSPTGPQAASVTRLFSTFSTMWHESPVSIMAMGMLSVLGVAGFVAFAVRARNRASLDARELLETEMVEAEGLE